MKQLLIFIQLLFTLAVFGQFDNSNWSFVGPISENLENGNRFETGKFEFLAEHPSDPLIIAVGGYQAGLWITYDGAETWENISTIPIGTNGISSLSFDNNGDILVSNYANPKYESIFLPYTFGMSRYDLALETWFSLGNIPIVGEKYEVNAISTHPTDNLLKFAGTTRGLFRSTDGGLSWALVMSAEYRIRQVKFAYNYSTSLYDVYVSGTDMNLAAASESEIRQCFAGTDSNRGALLMRSTDDGMNFTELTDYTDLVRTSHADNDVFSTIFCFGKSPVPEETIIYTMCATIGTDNYNTVHEIVFNTDSETHTVEFLNAQHHTSDFTIVTPGRMGIGYLSDTHSLYCSGTQGFSINIGTKVLSLHGYSLGTILNPTTVHADLHEVVVSKFDPTQLYVVSDGGFYKINESNLTTATFKNNGLNVADINGFSGASHDPNYYVIGLFHIVHTSFFDQSIGGNRYTHKTHENDGALIDAFNNNLIIVDRSSYDNEIRVSQNGGATLGPVSTLPGQTDFGTPFLFQDPFRERLYVGLRAQFGLAQFDMTTKTFNNYKSQIAFAPYWHVSAVKTWGNAIYRMSFSRTDPNSVYLTTGTPYLNPEESFDMAYVVKYVGNDFDAMDAGALEHYDALGNRQWENITPDWISGSNLGAGLNTCSVEELRQVLYADIAQSNINNDIVFLANMNISKNETVKVLRYDRGVWNDYSAGIPENEYPRTMIIDPISNDGLYLITELGLYFRDASMSSWISYNDGLPQVYANQMEIHNSERTIRAGTYGRGIWKSGLKCPENVDYSESGIYSTNKVVEGRKIESVATTAAYKFAAYKANNRIDLSPGFSTQKDALFEALIENCEDGKPEPGMPNKEINNNFGTQIEPGTKTATEIAIKAYPNPSTGTITIDLGEDDAFKADSHYEVWSLNGELVSQGVIQSRQFDVNLAFVESGMYHLVLYLTEKSENFNIVIK